MIILWNERMYSIENFLYAYYSWMFTVNVTDEENDGQYADTTASLLNQLHQGALALEPLQDMKSQTIGNLPDDEDELLAIYLVISHFSKGFSASWFLCKMLGIALCSKY